MKTSQSRINKDHAALPGHFPGHPVVPGVVVLDEVFHAIKSQCPNLDIKEIKSVKFLSVLLPEQAFTIELDLKSASKVNFKCQNGDVVFCQGQCLLSADCDTA